ncbi:PG0541 family transporter-associated protein [Barnesiella sp. An55]|uniref:PG0541 family transporter-associated protein n=1 Tax=Barnesiella sp. An55 TaxID=1965646 RepID=UPI000B36B88B|nr:PG0541 family transporter-associated protein [Barnesiella sp. An55]OUN72857.1 hypothetical protein B5G10_06735 [Barnesiella sp. An55]HIZ27362.1 hypothetical protein [Candidatus Barnesiella merdipullorum]
MKSVFITFDQAHYVQIIETLDKLSCRGYSYFEQVRGRGSKTGEPHYGSHAWPSMCSAIITMVDDAKVEPLLKRLRQMDEEAPQLGLRAFVWTIEQSI